jgi:protein TonB
LAATAPAPSSNLERVQPAVAGGDGVQQGPVEFNNRMTPPRKISGPDPQYTDQALNHEVEGVMEARCIITVEGRVSGCRVVKGVLFMDHAVISALQLRRYSPALLHGKPVEIYYTFSTTLKLPR